MSFFKYVHATPESHQPLLQKSENALDTILGCFTSDRAAVDSAASREPEAGAEENSAARFVHYHPSPNFWVHESAMIRLYGEGNDVHHNCSLLHVAAGTGNLAVVEAALKADKYAADLATHRHFTVTMAAARGGSLECLKAILAAGPDSRRGHRAQRADANGMSAAMHAAAAGHIEIVQQLIAEAGTPVEHTDKAGHSLLMHAARSGSAPLVSWLVERGASVKHRHPETHRPVSMFGAQLGGAAVVRLLVDQWEQPVEDKDSRGTTLAMLAAQGGNVELLEFVHKQGASLVLRDQHGRTVLHYAATSADLPTMEYLLKIDAVKSHINNNDDQGITALMLAARTGPLALVKALVDAKADTCARDKHHRSVAMFAVESGHADVLKFLLDHGVTVGDAVAHARLSSAASLSFAAAQTGSTTLLDLVAHHGASLSDVDDHGVSVAMHAANSGSKEVIASLLSRRVTLSGADVAGRTVTLHAAHSGSAALMSFLIEKGVASFDDVDNEGVNVLMTAAASGSKPLVEVLVNAMGQEAAEKQLVAVDKHRQTVLMHAAATGSVKLVVYLIAQKAPAFSLDEKDRTALTHAAVHGHAHTIAVLLRAGTPANGTGDSDGMTPAHYAAKAGCCDSTAMLLREGKLDINAKSKDGLTVLMLAAESGAADLVEELLTLGADSSIVDKSGRTAVDYAHSQGNNVAERLITSMK